MQYNQLTCHFLKHARREYFICERERKCQDFYISIYREKDSNIRYLHMMIAGCLDNQELVNKLFHKVEGEDIVIAEKISSHNKRMIKTLSTRVFKRSGSSRLSITLLPLINTILVKVTRHREKILNEILVLVYKFLFTEAIDEDELSLVSGDIGALQTLLNHYVDNMHEHQQTLDFYLQSFQKQDTSSKAGIVLEEYTTQLMALIDRTVLYTTNTCRRLAEWRLALSRIENCELNN